MLRNLRKTRKVILNSRGAIIGKPGLRKLDCQISCFWLLNDCDIQIFWKTTKVCFDGTGYSWKIWEVQIQARSKLYIPALTLPFSSVFFDSFSITLLYSRSLIKQPSKKISKKWTKSEISQFFLGHSLNPSSWLPFLWAAHNNYCTGGLLSGLSLYFSNFLTRKRQMWDFWGFLTIS